MVRLIQLQGLPQYRAENIRLSSYGAEFTLVTPEWTDDLKTKLIGKYNVSNILAAVAAASGCGMKRSAIKEGIESFSLVPGRLEVIDEGQPFKVFVDFAHTEDALINVLSILRKVARRNIITIFGCGGNRDRTKRPLMGKAACRLSDRVVITSDNPRFEDPLAIIREIEEGIKGKFSNYHIEPDRQSAIERALSLAAKDDIVVIAGKGHERCQIIGDNEMPFNDCEVARSILRRAQDGGKMR